MEIYYAEYHCFACDDLWEDIDTGDLKEECPNCGSKDTEKLTAG